MHSELNIQALYPELVLALVALVLLLLDALFWPRRRGHAAGYMALCGVLVALSLALGTWSEGGAGAALYGAVRMDAFACFFVLFLLAALLFSLLLALHERPLSEHYPLALLAVLGSALAAAAADLLIVFLGIELAGLSLAVLAAMGRRQRQGVEAALKLYLPGLLGGVLLLYGAALVYAATGSTALEGLGAAWRESGETAGALRAGLVLVLCGLGLRLAAFPFHMWAPDAQEGAPLPVAGLLASAPRAAAFAALARLVVQVGEGWAPLLWWLAAATLVAGGLLALNQRRPERLMACLGIAHGGYAIVGLVSGSQAGLAAALFHLAGLGLTSFGLCALLAICRWREKAAELSDYRGLGLRHPALGLALALFAASLAGLPPTALFFGRLFALEAAVEAGFPGLALVGALAGLLTFCAAARMAVGAYMRPGPELPPLRPGPEALAALLLAALGTLALGLWPGPLLAMAGAGVAALM